MPTMQRKTFQNGSLMFFLGLLFASAIDRCSAQGFNECDMDKDQLAMSFKPSLAMYDCECSDPCTYEGHLLIPCGVCSNDTDNASLTLRISEHKFSIAHYNASDKTEPCILHYKFRNTYSLVNCKPNDKGNLTVVTFALISIHESSYPLSNVFICEGSDSLNSYSRFSNTSVCYNDTFQYTIDPRRELRTPKPSNAVKPTMELPSTFYFVDGSVADVTCSARNAVPEARIFLKITSAANRSLYLQSATGVTNAVIVFNASLTYHKAAVVCTIQNCTHQLAPKTSEILVFHISRKASEINSQPRSVTLGDVLNCSERVDSYPHAEFRWYIDDALNGTDSSFSVPHCNAQKLECVATNSAANASVHVPYTVNCSGLNYYYLFFLLAIPIAVYMLIACLKRKQKRAAYELIAAANLQNGQQERGNSMEVNDNTRDTSTAGDDVELRQLMKSE